MSIITQDQYSIVKQRYRNILIKINLLNFNFQVVDSLEGNLISGNVVINANSDIRRTCNITMVMKNHTFKIEAGGQIWFDKYIQIYYGIIKNSTQEVIWTNLGIYIINNPSHIYDSVNNTLSFQGLDLMAKLTGMRNGYYEWLNGTIGQGEEVRGLFIDLLHQAGFNRYNIENLINKDGNPLTLPYEVEVSATSTLYGVLEEIRNNVMPNYEMFFDINGIFTLKRIYNNASDPIIIDNDIWDVTILNIANDIDFESVKNVIEIWGQTLEPVYGNPICEEYHQQTPTVIDGYYCEISSLLQTYNEGDIPEVIPTYSYIGFGIQNIVETEKPYLKINDFDAHPIINKDKDEFFEFQPPKEGEVDYYVVVYDDTKTFDSQTGVFNLLGYQQIHYIIKDTNIDSPFYVGGTIGEILLPLAGGDYDNIQTNEQAKDRAEWELYNYARMNDKIRLTSTVIPWIDVNQKIEYINEDAELSGIFIIKNVSMDLAVEGTMTLECIRWYDYDPFDDN